MTAVVETLAERFAEVEVEVMRPPRPLPSPLPPVAGFDLDLMPASLRELVEDSADALQVPHDFVAVPLVIAAGGVIGRRFALAMKSSASWTERPLLWGGVVGRPSSGKSPALRPAVGMLQRLESQHRQQWEAEQARAALDAQLGKLEQSAAKKAASKALKEGDRDAAREALRVEMELSEAAPEPRLVVNDSTIEKLGETLNANPRGVVLIRDELAGWLANLDREGREGDRAFFLESWNGQGQFTVDRIGRGTVRIEAPAVCILGGVQPGKLSEYVRGAVRGGGGDDGLVQRLGMLVWPDLPTSWRYCDRPANQRAEASAWSTFQRLDSMTASGIGATLSDRVDVPFLHFDPEAQEVFAEWLTSLMMDLRAGGYSPWLESHLSKYPALAGRLALTLHLCDSPQGGPVGVQALAKALAWCSYLETHARRLYAIADGGGVQAAHMLLARKSDLPGDFTAREVYRRGWAGLDREAVEDALEVLVDHGHLDARDVDSGGRPTTIYGWRVTP